MILFSTLFLGLATMNIAKVMGQAAEVPQLAGDKLPSVTCQQLAASNDCKNDKEYMKEHCQETCKNWSEIYAQFKPFYLPRDEFWELSAAKASSPNSKKNSILEFEDLEGYVTFFLPLARMCTKVNDDNEKPKVKPQTVFESIERMAQVYPHAVEVLVFPYQHPDVNYDDKSIFNCDEFDTLIQTSNEKYKKSKQHRNIHIMKEISLKEKEDENGNKLPDSEPVHPVFQFFLKALKFPQFALDTQFYLIVRPDAMEGSYHYGKSLLDMHDMLALVVKDLGQREL